MKAINIIFLSLFVISGIHAQQISDGLRYSTEQNLGTARYTALSGAMGALGGDMSAISHNPAGSAVFLRSHLTLSGALADMENSSSYFNNREKSFATDVTLNQVGGVFVFNNPHEGSAFRRFTIGINYDVARNFENEIYFGGKGNTSVNNFFLAQAEGLPLDLLQLQTGESISSLYRYLGETRGPQAQNAFMGFQGYLFDPVDPGNPNNTSYISNVRGNSFNQEYLNLSRGYNSKFTLNFATQLMDDYYFGVNLNTHTIDFDRSNVFLETNANINSPVNKIGFENNLSVYGAGVSAQFGAIAKVAENFRFGLNLDTPTWYQISEETSQYLETRHTVDGRNRTEVINPNVINVYEDYTLRTPGKVGASVAYVFNQFGFVSFDYSYKDYSNLEFRPSNDAYFRDLNRAIKNNLTGSSSFKAGAEYRLNNLSLRGGFHYEQSPYKNTDVVGDLSGFSLGTGYNFGNVNFDLAYSRSEQESNFQPYSTGFTESADINSVYSSFILSLGFKF